MMTVRQKSTPDSFRTKLVIIIIVLPPVACQSNRTITMVSAVDGDAISRCQILGRAGSVRHVTDQYMLHGHTFLVSLFTHDRPTCVRNRLSASHVVPVFHDNHDTGEMADTITIYTTFNVEETVFPFVIYNGKSFSSAPGSMNKGILNGCRISVHICLSVFNAYDLKL